MSTISVEEMDKKLDQKNRKERNKEKLEEINKGKLEKSTKIQQPCTKCSESFQKKKELINHMINVHDLLRSEAERVSTEIFPLREKFNHDKKKIHEDSKSDKDTDHIDRSMGMKVRKVVIEGMACQLPSS